MKKYTTILILFSLSTPAMYTYWQNPFKIVMTDTEEAIYNDVEKIYNKYNKMLSTKKMLEPIFMQYPQIHKKDLIEILDKKKLQYFRERLFHSMIKGSIETPLTLLSGLLPMLAFNQYRREQAYINPRATDINITGMSFANRKKFAEQFNSQWKHNSMASIMSWIFLYGWFTYVVNPKAVTIIHESTEKTTTINDIISQLQNMPD